MGEGEELRQELAQAVWERNQARRGLTEARQRAERLEAALRESVSLQSHYAGLLNGYDGGQRLQFPDRGELAGTVGRALGEVGR